MEITRRHFIKIGGLGLISAVALHTGSVHDPGDALADQVATVAGTPRWRFIIDTSRCIGCGRCVRACKLENNVPWQSEYNRTWVERYVFGDNDQVYVDSPDAGINGFTAEDINRKYPGLNVRKTFFVPKLCNQCSNPPCVPVCPVGATFKTKEGVVLIDRKACIGCRYCIQACPYGARYFDPKLKVVDKCTWCYHRITKGLRPACVEACPVGARMFGDLNDPQSIVSEYMRRKTMGTLKPEIGTDPKVFYAGLEHGVR